MNNTEHLTRFATLANLSGPFPPNWETLAALHHVWPHTIPFENIEVLLNRPISTALADIADKLLTRGRGGYCFEHNLLFKQVLEEAGFSVTPHLARVVWGLEEPAPTPQTHMLLIVTLEGTRYLADVGFGGVSLPAPLRLEEGEQQGFVLARTGRDQWLLSLAGPEQKRLMYLFDERPCEQVDIVVANHFVSTHPESLFRHNLIMAGLREEGQYNLFNQHLAIHGREEREQQAQSYSEFQSLVSPFFRHQNTLSEEDMQAIYAKLNG